MNKSKPRVRVRLVDWRRANGLEKKFHHRRALLLLAVNSERWGRNFQKLKFWHFFEFNVFSREKNSSRVSILTKISIRKEKWKIWHDFVKKKYGTLKRALAGLTTSPEPESPPRICLVSSLYRPWVAQTFSLVSNNSGSLKFHISHVPRLFRHTNNYLYVLFRHHTKSLE